ncbi:uncharacterized protein Tco025E_04594 [Trypanosoma conorhini]|uniref:Uncharacterized protein n=1 Tax=Trypanosoma conorhini TaxID=83891 RepID=A0A422PKH6_9TRYP|nr:uncharacterized protein Tco025E_04594 [Trypanosoma conorhini]RNF18209.1 hypothetical protein Tco025E_04594 [Trypanosoma conorhini]
MGRPRSAPHAVGLDANKPQPPRRVATAGGRHAVLQDASQDEVAFYAQRLAEIAAQHAKLEREFQQRGTANRRGIRKMHDENTHLRTIRAGTSDVTAAELDQLEQCKFVERRRLNRLTHQLEKLQDGIREAEELRRLDAAFRSAPSLEAVSGNRSVVLRIQKLEKLLDEMMSEQQCINNIRNMYTKLLEELREEEAGRESRVAVMEREIDTRQRQYEKLVVMFHNVTADHQVAQAALEEFKDKFQKTRRLKDKALGERRQRVEQALKETQELELREVKLQQGIEEEQQRIEDAETERQVILHRRKRAVSVAERLSTAQPDSHWQGGDNDGLLQTIGGSPEDEERLRAYEESLRKMMRVTESSTVDELVTNFELEYAARLQLQNQLREEKENLEQLSAEVQRLKEAEAKEKLCGVGQPPVSSCLREELLTCIAEASKKREEAMQEGMGLQRLFAELLRRVDVLAAATAMYRPEVRVPPTTADKLQTNLRIIGRKILSLADEAVSCDNGPISTESMLVVVPSSNTRIALPPPGAAGSTLDGGSNAVVSGGASEPGTSSDGIVPSSEPLEIRSSICSSVSSGEEDSQSCDRGVTLNDNEDPLTRDQIKRLAAVVLRREARRRQHEKRRQGRG